jgi:glycosyltransferase involved in cell wall biosynthesis
VKPGEVLLVTFGQVYPDKAPLEIVWCLRWLVTWGVNATLAFCGPAARETSEWTLGFAERLGMPGRIRFFDKPLPEEAYRDYLAAADIGIQLRTYGLGGLSGALNDCIAAAIPSISNAHLAEAMRAPSFVRTVPDMLSPLLMAEAAMDILDSGHNEARPVEEAASFAEEHSPRRYSELLLQGLGFDVARRAA